VTHKLKGITVSDAVNSGYFEVMTFSQGSLKFFIVQFLICSFHDQFQGFELCFPLLAVEGFYTQATKYIHLYTFLRVKIS